MEAGLGCGGRRNDLQSQINISNGSETQYTYHADGLMSTMTNGGATYNYTFGDNGLLVSRGNAAHTLTINSRDGRGRILTDTVTSNSSTPLSEVMTWRDDSKLDSYTANRSGQDSNSVNVWNETRQYWYNARGQLLTEPYKPTASTAETLTYQFDQNSENGPGVRTQAQVSPTKNYNVPATNGENTYLQVKNETAMPGDASSDAVQWWYDGDGNASSWNSATRGSKGLNFDTQNRLVGVTQRDNSNNGYNWSAIYDGLGRRIQTVTQPVIGGSPTGAPVTVQAMFDPQVEFLELGLQINGAMSWRAVGPDLSGVYGGKQGVGGIEAFATSGGVLPVISNAFGDVVASVGGGGVSWNPAQVGSYGLLPGSNGVTLSVNTDWAKATVWRSRYLDVTGFYNLGARYYDPQSGRFLSADPLGHASSLTLYDYANGDPVNGVDADGRYGASAFSSGYTAPTSKAFDAGPMANLLSSPAAFNQAQAQAWDEGEAADEAAGKITPGFFIHNPEVMVVGMMAAVSLPLTIEGLPALGS
ncbi:MAG: RHS repeat-associated core domain-containing protein [Chthoniobacteraceae bacterium]